MKTETLKSDVWDVLSPPFRGYLTESLNHSQLEVGRFFVAFLVSIVCSIT